MLKVISDIIAQWDEIINTFIFTINLIDNKMSIADHKHQCTIHFLCIAEIKKCIYQFIAIYHYARNDFKHIIVWF